MKKRTPAYKEIREILDKMKETIKFISAAEKPISRKLLSQIYDVEFLLRKIEASYQNAAKKSNGPRVKTAKKARASRENLRKATLALTPEQRSERARKAVLVRWAKTKEKEKEK